MDFEQNYQEIEELEETDIRDLCFHLLYRWRSILLVALACMTALGFWQNYRVESVHAKGELTEEEESWELSVQSYYNSIENAQNIIFVRTRQIAEEQEYLNQSIYLNLDSANEWTGTRVWYLKSTPEAMAALPEGSQIDPTDYAINAYVSAVNANLDSAELERILGTSRLEYVHEMVTVSSDIDNNTITVFARADSAEKVETILDFFSDRMDAIGEDKAQAVSGHTRMLMSEDIKQVTTSAKRSYNGVELDRAGEIRARQENIEKWQQEIVSAQTSLNKLLRDEEPKAPGKHVIRYAVIGFAAGALVMLVLYAAMYLMGGRIHTGEDISRVFNCPLYGSLVHSRARRPGKGIDGLIEKWEFRHDERDDGKVYDCIAVLLQEEAANGTLLLTSTLPAEKLQRVQAQTQKRLTDRSIEIAADILRNPEAMSQAKAADMVLLVEEKHVTRFADVKRELDVLEIGGAEVNGTILL